MSSKQLPNRRAAGKRWLAQKSERGEAGGVIAVGLGGQDRSPGQEGAQRLVNIVCESHRCSCAGAFSPSKLRSNGPFGSWLREMLCRENLVRKHEGLPSAQEGASEDCWAPAELER